ncbi:MAG: glycoside hydrolase family 2 protein [Spirochaetota bacterium]
MKIVPLTQFAFAFAEHGVWSLADIPSLAWHPARMPGDSIRHLRDAGIETADPNVMDHQKAYLPYETKDFFYRTIIDVKHDIRYRLAADGLDTFSDVYVNGALAYSGEDSFIRFSLDITGWLVPGTNELLFVFKSPIRTVDERVGEVPAKKHAVVFDEVRRVWMRKPQFHYGWDNAPHLAGVGFIGTPKLIAVDENVFVRDVIFDCEYDWREKRASFAIRAFLSVFTKTSLEAELRWNGVRVWGGEAVIPAGEHEDRTIASGTMDDVHAWNIRGYGEPDRYECVILADGCELFHRKIGIRHVKLSTKVLEKRRVSYEVRSPGKSSVGMDGTAANVGSVNEEVIDGLPAGPWSRVKVPEHEVDVHEFRLIVNGVPIFLRGYDWQPLENNLSNISDERYAAALSFYKESGANAVRVWGGAYIEDERFYDFCDENGIVVWQDFQFACALYPDDDDGFKTLIAREVSDIHTRLNLHPSLCMYCGSNEIDMSLHDRGLDRRAHNTIGYEVIPNTLSALGSRVPYHVSSPWGVDYPRSPFSGENRNWTAREYVENDYPLLRKDECAMNSEGGAPAFPSRADVRDFFMDDMPLDENALESIEAYRLHAGSTLRWHRKEYLHGMWRNVRAHFGQWRSIDELIYLTQLFQADALTRYIENFRFREKFCGGALIWKFTDTWPNVELTVLDYGGRPKMAYYSVRRAMQDTVICPFFDDREFLFGISTTLPSLWGALAVDVVHVDGSVRETMSEDISMTRGVHHAGIRIMREALRERYGAGNVLLRARLVRGDLALAERIFIPETYRTMHVHPGDVLDVRTMPSAGGTDIELTARETAFGVSIRMADEHALPLRLSDNAFTLVKGDRRTIRVSGYLTAQEITVETYNGIRSP